MAPNRVMFIRHAEKPGFPPGSDGVTADGEQDDESLTVRGWQRAGALAHFFNSQPKLRPQTVFASGTGHGSKSNRPVQTVTPAVDLFEQTAKLPFVTSHLKDDLQGVMSDVLSRTGIVLVCWQHELIPDLVKLLPNPPQVPQHWPGSRFDMVWVFDTAGAGWSFSQVPQMLLAGDSADPIS
ncbi:MAG: hypothetical protein QOD11_3355 [Bradyrhizobium sp.]|jgi:hypothetical protein|nr:hypothetical protein [Bradyrhizobium sp.]